jgi:hypothetical protein
VQEIVRGKLGVAGIKMPKEQRKRGRDLPTGHLLYENHCFHSHNPLGWVTHCPTYRRGD